MKTNDIKLEGESIEGFERVEKIESIILIGNKGGVRRIDIQDASSTKTESEEKQ